MFKFPKKFIDRVQLRLRPYKAITQNHRKKDVSEADTVTVVKDIMCEVFGYNKYEELTSEQQVRGTFCDLAIRIDGKIRMLIEVKSAGLNLSDGHIRQALNYGVNQGIEWIILTNSIDWFVYKIKFGQPVDYDKVCVFSINDIDLKIEEDVSKIFIVSREGMVANAINDYHLHKQIVNKFTVSQILISDSVLQSVRREFRRIFPDLKISEEAISDLIKTEILKRELLEGDKYKEAASVIKKAINRNARAAAKLAPKAITVEDVASDC
jgi:hypothetical protein